MNKQPRITFGTFGSAHPSDVGDAYVYADGERVGEIWRHSGRFVESNSRGPWFVACYVVQIWADDVGNNDPAFVEYVRDGRGNVVQTAAQAKRALRNRIAEHFESLESDAA